MAFSREPFPETKSAWSIKHHGPDTPFRHWSHVKEYISALLSRNGYDKLVEYNTTVELVQRNDSTTNPWTLTLRKPVSPSQDRWWTEPFDAVIVANGHYHVPYLPPIPSLSSYAAAHPGIITHSKSFRSPASYANKRVVVIGASISGPDIAHSLAVTGKTLGPVTCVVRGKYHPYFFDYAFQHPRIVRKHGISHFDAETSTVHFADGTTLEKPDAVIFGTGYTWTLPFLENEKSGVDIHIRNNRLPGLYQHVFWRDDPSLCFVGAVAAGFTFKVFEWQAVLVARYLAGRITLPSKEEQARWEEERVKIKGDGVPFSALYPNFEEYFEEVRALAGEPIVLKGEDGAQRVIGRSLPRWEKWWREEFDAAHLRRIEMWKNQNKVGEEEEKLYAKRDGANGADDKLEAKEVSETSKL